MIVPNSTWSRKQLGRCIYVPTTTAAAGEEAAAAAAARANLVTMSLTLNCCDDLLNSESKTLYSRYARYVTCSQQQQQAFVSWSSTTSTKVWSRSSQLITTWHCARYPFTHSVLPTRRTYRTLQKWSNLPSKSAHTPRPRHARVCACERSDDDRRNDKSGKSDVGDETKSNTPIPSPSYNDYLSLSDNPGISADNPGRLKDSTKRSDGVETYSQNGATTTVANESQSSSSSHDRFKIQRRISVGFLMGAVVIAFVFSGRWLFAIGMLGISLTGLYEYYRMVAAKGHLPAYKTGLCVTAATMSFSAFAPQLADVAFPVGGTFICIYLLFRQSKIATIADISTTFMGLFYAGYLPSYWIRLHEYTPYAPDNVVASTIGRLWLGRLLGFQPTITVGSLLVFWTWLSAASADIGAFFIGRTYGRTRFSHISPKKTVEGAIAGFICSASVSILGAYLLHWPLWWATGAVYGIIVGVLGLCGDLFESCFKRDVGWKDSGSLFPGHGGMLDRADSYVLVAPLVYFFATMVLPAIKHVIR